jgi:CBS domain-containing protein
MAEANLRHLPVIDEEQLAGLVSIRDLVGALLAGKGK